MLRNAIRALFVTRHSFAKPYLLSRVNVPNRALQTATSGSPVILRPYQEACVESCLEALSNGSTRIGVSSPTGSGKTTIFVSLIARLGPPPSRPDATRSLIIVNSIELARQAAQAVHSMYPALSVEIEQGQKNRATGLADVTVATYQTLIQPGRLGKFDRKKFKAVIIDEAHHAAASSYRNVLSYFDPQIKFAREGGEGGGGLVMEDHGEPSSGPPVPIIGFSATFSRHDGVALGSVFERIVYHRDFLEMIQENWLCPVRFTCVEAKLDLSEVTINSRTGEFNATSLAHVINTDTINSLVVQSWLDRASTRRSTLVFCVNIAHVRDLTNEYRSRGVDARFLHSKTPTFERRALLDAFRAGEFPVLVNCAILTEGADIPNIDCVIVAKPTRSRNIFAQMIGRGMRLSPATGKEDCHIIDFVDTTERVGGVLSAPTLFGLEPDGEIEDVSLEELKERAEQQQGSRSPTTDVPEPTHVTYKDYDNPWELARDESRYIAKLSSFSWVGCAGDTYVLECLGKGYIKIEPAPPDDGKGGKEEKAKYVAYHYPAALDKEGASFMGPGVHYFRKRLVLSAATLDAAVKGCDNYAVQKILHGPMVTGLQRSARWRRDPATDNQKKFIAKRLKLGDPSTAIPEDMIDSPTTRKPKPISLQTLTKGQAGDIITRLRHGVQGAAQAKKKVALRAVKEAERLAKHQARVVVKVGPLASG